MSRNEYHTETIGRCLTRYVHKSQSEISDKASGYVTLSQFGRVPKVADINPKTYYETYHDGTRACGIGEICYAVVGDNLIMIYAKIDSSD